MNTAILRFCPRDTMAQLPNHPDKHSLGALSRLPGRSITGAPPLRSIQTQIRTCREKNIPFPKPVSTWHALHCTSKLGKVIVKICKAPKSYETPAPEGKHYLQSKPSGEDTELTRWHIAWLQKEMLHKQPDTSKVTLLMDRTLHDRCNRVVEDNIPIAELLGP